MGSTSFKTPEGIEVPAVTADQMREVDRIAEQVFKLSVLQMMENAGRNLALHVIEMLGGVEGNVAIVSGPGGNGGGGICCTRHLHNRGVAVELILSQDLASLKGAARDQLQILQSAGFLPVEDEHVNQALGEADLVIDALIGYSLKGAPRGRVEYLIKQVNLLSKRVLALDVPSGLDSTSGETPGAIVNVERTLTLALPKTGLAGQDGELYLADIGIPPEVYLPLGIRFQPFFGDQYWIRLHN